MRMDVSVQFSHGCQLACMAGYKEDWSCDKGEVMEWDPSGRVGRRRPGKCRLRMSHVFCWGVISRRRLGLDFRSWKAGRIEYRQRMDFMVMGDG